MNGRVWLGAAGALFLSIGAAFAQGTTISSLPAMSPLNDAALFPCEVPGAHTQSCSIEQIVQQLGGLDADGGLDEPLGLITPNSGAFTNVLVNGTLSFGPSGLLDVTTARTTVNGITAPLGTVLLNLQNQTAGLLADITPIDIHGGINEPIGLTTPNAGVFTNVTVNGTLLFGPSGVIDPSAQVLVSGTTYGLDALLATLLSRSTTYVGKLHGVTKVSTGTAYTTLATDDFVEWLSTASGAKTTTLDACSTTGEPHTIVAGSDAGTNTQTVTAASGDLIAGQATFAMTAAYESVDLVCDGSHNWMIH